MATQMFKGKPSSRSFATVDISTAANGLSSPINITGLTLTNIQMPAAWTQASVGVNACVDGTTNFLPVYGSTGDLLAYQTSASRLVVLNPDLFRAFGSLQFVSMTTNGSSAVAQAAARIIKIGLAEV